MSWKTK